LLLLHVAVAGPRLLLLLLWWDVSCADVLLVWEGQLLIG
jgi:hypothetical protein